MNNMNFSPEKMDTLLKLASQKLGQSPDEIKNKLENGDLNQLIGKLDPKTQDKIASFMNNPTAVEALMKNNNIKNLVDNFSNGQK